jgi:hypothetical protein
MTIICIILFLSNVVLFRWLKQSDDKAEKWELDARYWFNCHEKLRRERRTQLPVDPADYWKEL